MYWHEHFVLALVPLLAYIFLRYRRVPSKSAIGAVLIGSIFPDLVDKPFAHYLSILPSGRVFMHSLPVSIPFCLAVLWYGLNTDRIQLAGAFTLGVLLHPLGDFYKSILSGSIPAELFWPFLAVQSTGLPSWKTSWTALSLLPLAVLLIISLGDILIQYREYRMK